MHLQALELIESQCVPECRKAASTRFKAQYKLLQLKRATRRSQFTALGPRGSFTKRAPVLTHGRAPERIPEANIL